MSNISFNFGSIPIEAISIGMQISYSQTVTDSDIKNFAGLSGDHNPVHVDEIFAQRNETRVNVTIPSKRIKNYFPEEYTKEQMESVIYELLEEWSHKKGIVQ